MLNCLFVGLGGFVGSVLRYLVGMIPINEPLNFPFTTLLINVLGSFVIGVIAGASARNTSIAPELILFLKVGLCGGFTTFSTFSLEFTSLIQNGRIMACVIYVVASIVLSAIAVIVSEFVFL